jgi:hypothetical protein
MILEMHLCGPKGDGQRQLLDRALALVQLDNQFLIEAMLRGGRDVPDLVDDMGLQYRPPTRREAATERERFWGMRKMMEEGSFSCHDAAAYEAAVLSVKYSIPAQAFSEQLPGPGLWHGVYRSQQHGHVDPVARYLAKQGRGGYQWEALRA